MVHRRRRARRRDEEERRMRQTMIRLTCALAITVGLAVGTARAEDPTMSFTVVNIEYEGSKVWTPGTLVVKKGTLVKVKLVNNVTSDPNQHGFAIPAYNLEWFGGVFHTDWWFAIAWGGFVALTGAFAQTGRVTAAAVFVAVGCAMVSLAQRRLSTPVRRLRRQVSSVSGEIVLADGTHEPIDFAVLRAAPEGALRAMWVAMVLLAVGLIVARPHL
jgi:hypothetical protein